LEKIDEGDTMITRLVNKILPFCFCVACFSLSAAETVIKRLNYTILTEDNPSAVCKTAANELAGILEKSYDRPIKLNGNDKEIVFFVGVSDEAIRADFAELPDVQDKFAVFRKGRSFLFHGYDDQDTKPEQSIRGQAGTLLAVYYFLTRYAGTQFFFPGEDGYSVSKDKEILFPADQDIPEPSFTLRGFSLQTKEYPYRERAMFFRRMLCSIPIWGQLDIYYVYLNKWKKRFFVEHPEYFMMRNGKRISENYPNHVPCFSNPDVIQQTVSDIIEILNREPAKKTVKIFCDAPINLCECDACKAMPERKIAGNGMNVSESVYGFQKKIADIIHQTHPDVYFLTQTKGRSYYEPPKLVNLGDRFTVNILASPHLTAVKHQAFALETAKKWQDAGMRTMIFGYPRYTDIPTKNMPVITPHFTKEYLKAFHGLTSGTAISELNNNPYSFSALNQFVQAKLLFDLNTDTDKLIKEFCAFAYPGAEDEMIRFYAEMERLYRDRKDVHFDPLCDIYSSENLQKPMRLLDDAAGKISGTRAFFDKLHADFKVFYERSLAQKEKAEELKAYNKVRLQQTENSLALPFSIQDIDISLPPDKWEKALSLQFSAPQPIENFQGSRLYLISSKSHLYVGLVADESKMSQLQAHCQQNFKGDFWSDDNFEFMLMPPDQQNYYQIVINANAYFRVLSQPGLKNATDFEMEAKAIKSPEGWAVAMKIPLAQLGKIRPGQAWKFNAFRNRLCGEKSQASGVRMLGANFHKTENYATLLWPDAITEK
jgi:hypothetical protein